ncbi:MAG: hypothetical protein CM1200mP1_16630 [Candidatus Neomarinimicrobiota bacterium]|nr:MAG: hypothetical protein CM1200mP1_16630 [Candidatus Neomarinimicrobiota bacterium]
MVLQFKLLASMNCQFFFLAVEKQKVIQEKCTITQVIILHPNVFLKEFIDENPNHANIARAKKLAVESERRIPYQLMREGMSFDKRGMMPRAVEKYIRAKSLADTL